MFNFIITFSKIVLSKNLTKAQKEKYLKEYEELMQKKYGGIAQAKLEQAKLEQAKGIIREMIGIIDYLNEDEYAKEWFPVVRKAEAFLKE